MSTLSDFFYEQAQKTLAAVEPVPPAPTFPPPHIEEPAGSPEVDWALDTRPTYKLTDAEALAKMNWQFQALCKRERLQRALDVPTVYPEVK